MSKKNTTKKAATKKPAANGKPLSGAQAAALVAKMKGRKGGKTKAATPEVTPTVEIVTGQPVPEKKTKAKKERKAKRVSALDAAAQILEAEGKPLNCKALIEAMAARGLWTSPNGKTPDATLYAAVIREIATKGADSRFRKADRGLFEFNR